MADVGQHLATAITSSRPRWRAWFVVAIFATVLAGGLAYWLRVGNLATARELAAKAELAKLGALVVMDSQRKHVDSVNLTTLKSADTLDQAVSLLAAMKHIRSLNVDGTKFQDRHALIVGQMTSLENLVLNRTAITDAALEKLVGLSQLKTLQLVDTSVTNAGMDSVGRMRALMIIDLSGAKVTGNFAPLGRLQGLKWLVAQRLSLEATAIAAIGECPSLGRLTLKDSTCPSVSLDELAQKRPGLTIDR